MQKEINKKVASSLGSKGRRAQHDKRHAAGEAGFEEDSSSLTQKDIDKKVPTVDLVPVPAGVLASMPSAVLPWPVPPPSMDQTSLTATTTVSHISAVSGGASKQAWKSPLT